MTNIAVVAGLGQSLKALYPFLGYTDFELISVNCSSKYIPRIDVNVIADYIFPLERYATQDLKDNHEWINLKSIAPITYTPYPMDITYKGKQVLYKPHSLANGDLNTAFSRGLVCTGYTAVTSAISVAILRQHRYIGLIGFDYNGNYADGTAFKQRVHLEQLNKHHNSLNRYALSKGISIINMNPESAVTAYMKGNIEWLKMLLNHD